MLVGSVAQASAVVVLHKYDEGEESGSVEHLRSSSAGLSYCSSCMLWLLGRLSLLHESVASKGTSVDMALVRGGLREESPPVAFAVATEASVSKELE